MIKVIMFDIDNTLLSFDGYVKSTMKSGFEYFGLGEYNDGMFEVFTRVNGGLWKALERGELNFEELQKIRWNRIFEALGIRGDGISFEKYFRDNIYDNAILESNALEIIKYLSEKYLLCVASNGPFDQQINRLKVGGLYKYFKGFFMSEEVGHSKPSTSFFEICLERLNKLSDEVYSPSDIAIVGDSLSSDIAGGVNFGMTTCYYNPKQNSVPDNIKIDYTINDLIELKDIF